MKLIFANVKRFLAQISEILMIGFSMKKGLFLSIILLDSIGALFKIGFIFVIALSIEHFSSDNSGNFIKIGLDISKDLSGVLILGAVIGVISLVGALATFLSIFLARTLGRWANTVVLKDIIKFIIDRPLSNEDLPADIPSNINSLFTQTPVHVGLALENIARLLNPIILMLFCYFALMYQRPYLALVTTAFCLFAAPIMINTAVKIRSNAKLLYGDAASKMGIEINDMANSLIYQHGMLDKTRLISQLDHSKTFLNSLDINLLANQRTALLVALLDSVVRPAIFILLGTLLLRKEVSPQEAVLLLGTLGYFLAASRGAVGFMTNLVRFQPQVDRYIGIYKSSGKNTKKKYNPKSYVSSSDINNQIDHHDLEKQLATNISMVTGSVNVDAFNLPKFSSAVAKLNQIDRKFVANNLFFINAKYRFHVGAPLNSLFSKQKTFSPNALSLFDTLTMSSDFKSLVASNKNTMNERLWSTFTSKERFICRIAPFFRETRTKRFLVLEFSVLSALSKVEMNNFFEFFNSMNQMQLYILVPDPRTATNLPDVNNYLSYTQQAPFSTITSKQHFLELLPNTPTETRHNDNKSADIATFM